MDWSLAAPAPYCAEQMELHPSSEDLFFIFLFYFYRLLYSVLPPSVANELRHKRPVPAKRYDNVTILFSGIVGFNAFCSKHASAEGAIKIVNLLNDVYTRFDILTDSRKNPYVYKVGSKNFTITVSNLISVQGRIEDFCIKIISIQLFKRNKTHKTDLH